MAHPLTPREKVAAVVLDAAASYLIQQYGVSHGLDHEVDRERIISAIPNDAILTALASGSGDHAELASLMRLTKRLRGIAFDYIGKADRTTCIETEAANAIEFLLAENAALRAQSDFYKRDNDVLMKNAWVSRATEAERKLAEAVSVMDQIREAVSISKARDLARTFLSKEAERG